MDPIKQVSAGLCSSLDMYRWWARGDAMRPPALLQSSPNLLDGDMVIMVRGGGIILETSHFYTIYF